MRKGEEDEVFKEEMEVWQSAILSCSEAQLPEGTDYHYFKTFNGFNEAMVSMQERLHAMLLQFPAAAPALGPNFLQSPEDSHLAIMDILDAVFDKVDKAVDDGYQEIQNLNSAESTLHQGGSISTSGALQVEGKPIPSAKEKKKADWEVMKSAAASSNKPQSSFKDDVDNSNQVFAGKLDYWRSLVEGKIPVPDCLAPYVHHIELTGKPGKPPHPLQPVIRDFEYPDHALATPPPTMYKSLGDTPFHYVDTLEDLLEMSSRLEGAKEIAVDLEAHSFRSFQGFTCLMQISNREEDWIVDVLKLRKQIGPVLAPVFANPKIVKVFHGSNWDVQWLQRDFGIYVVNLFDTGQAARVLKLAKIGLAYLLEYFCQVKTDKKYQLADWRVRPIPEDMMKYARMDTHYLLYIYDCVKIKLSEVRTVGTQPPPEDQCQHRQASVTNTDNTEQNALKEVLKRSRELSLLVYEKPLFSKSDYLECLNGYKKSPHLNAIQEEVFRGLYQWRDEVARERDESLEFVLPKQHLLNLAMSLPGNAKEMKAVLGTGTPSLVLAVSSEILQVIAEGISRAKDVAANEAATKVGEASPLPQNQPDAATQISAEPALNLHLGLKSNNATQQPSSMPGLQIQGDTISRPVEQSDLKSNPPAEIKAAFLESHDKQNLTVSDEFQLKPKVFSNALPFKPLQAKASSSGMGSMFGGRRKPSIQPILPPKLGAFLGSSTLSSSSESTDLERVEALRAGIQLPIPSVPPAAQAVTVQQPRDEDAAQQPRQVSGLEIRAVADAMRSESTVAEEKGDKKRSCANEESLGDFLPLPISERYPKYQKRPRHEPQAKEEMQNLSAQQKQDTSSPSEDEGEEQSESGDDAVDAILKATGLQSDSEDEKHKAPQRPPDTQPKKKRKKALGDGSLLKAFDVTEDRAREPSLQAQEPEHPSETVPFERLHDSVPDMTQDGHFDYSNARADAPGLHLDLEQPAAPSRGRGRGRRGRGGRGRNVPAPKSGSKTFSLYQLDESQFLKGGKRSAVNQRGGNKNLTFGAKR